MNKLLKYCSYLVLDFIQEDDEWKEFEEEQEVDLTGLRIKEMQVA